MKLDPTSRDKASGDLQALLETTDADARVRVVLILGGAGATVAASSAAMHRSDLHRSDYGSSTDYRRALIDRRRTEVRDLTADTVRDLEKLSLQVTGGEIGRAVVAEGPAGQIARALALDGVSSAILDAPIGLD
ncbi:hypothetical protein [Methylobacterium platani]|uniref:Uncharacterized protein n=2 Tax=Methylobacterium platani TaxID=427683 RepID=A0A179SH77_9HYPH|nr:hypothetical protein [Methylobacterium platani]KMO12226.1 hypothetical protein SQ03_25070 [Methylobacterium platani JCM 14648]OAS26945.1 hypothetical protein A5481_02965 [Methylobacterium platani]